MQKIVIVSHSNNIAATQKMIEIKCKTLSFEVFLLPISRVLAKMAVTRRVLRRLVQIRITRTKTQIHQIVQMN